MGRESAPSIPLCWMVMASLAMVCGSVVSARAQTIVLQTAAGGTPISGSNDTWTSGFGNVNGLGIGTPSAGLTVITSGVTGGVLYTTPVNFVVSGAGGGNRAVIRVYASTNFTHPSVLALRVCYPASGCSAAANYQQVSLSSGTPTDLIPRPGVLNGTHTAWLGLFVSNLNGPAAFTGADPATLTFITTAFNGTSETSPRDTDTLSLSSPAPTVQTALRLSLAAAGGLPVVPASDFSMAFGNVNAMGIGPAAGLTVSFPSGGALYKTPYSIQPAFSSFSATTASVTAYVSVDFAHPAILELRDSPDDTTFSAISKIVASPTTISSAMTSGSALTRHLGLFVSGLNGAGAFTGADSASVRYTMVVP